MSSENYKDKFLIAMPSLNDPNFTKSVIYLYEHNEDGAMGLIINKPLHINLGNVLRHLDIEITDRTVETHPVLMGGPIGQEHGFVIHDNPEEDEYEIEISASKETLTDIAQGNGPGNFLVALGYAGWSSGQIESEIQRNDWLVAPFDINILFSTPIENRWHAAAKLIGVDLSQLSDQIGHA